MYLYSYNIISPLAQSMVNYLNQMKNYFSSMAPQNSDLSLTATLLSQLAEEDFSLLYREMTNPDDCENDDERISALVFYHTAIANYMRCLVDAVKADTQFKNSLVLDQLEQFYKEIDFQLNPSVVFARYFQIICMYLNINVPIPSMHTFEEFVRAYQIIYATQMQPVMDQMFALKDYVPSCCSTLSGREPFEKIGEALVKGFDDIPHPEVRSHVQSEIISLTQKGDEIKKLGKTLFYEIQVASFAAQCFKEQNEKNQFQEKIENYVAKYVATQKFFLPVVAEKEKTDAKNDSTVKTQCQHKRVNDVNAAEHEVMVPSKRIKHSLSA